MACDLEHQNFSFFWMKLHLQYYLMQTEIGVIFSSCCNSLNMKKINKIRKPNFKSVVNLDSKDFPSVWFSSSVFPRNFCSPSGVLGFFLVLFSCWSQLPNNTTLIILEVFPQQKLLITTSPIPPAPWCDDTDLLKERRKIVSDENCLSSENHLKK